MGTGTMAAAGTAETINIGKFEEYLDRATDEVFSVMLGSGCTLAQGTRSATGTGRRLSLMPR